MTVRCEIAQSRRETGARTRDYSLQYVDRLSGEPARLHAAGPHAGLSRSEWAIAAEALMNIAG